MIDDRYTFLGQISFCLFLLMGLSIGQLQVVCADSSSAQPHRSQETSVPQNASLKSTFHTMTPQALRWTGEGAWQPPQGEWYMGLSESYWAPFSWLSLHTWSTPWFIGAANLGIRLPLWTRQNWSLGLSAHLMRLNLSRLDDGEGTSSQAIRVSPISLYTAYQVHPKWLLGAELRYTIVSGSTQNNQDQSLQGVAATSNSHLRLQLAYVLGERWSFWWIWSRLNQQSTTVNAYSNVSLQNGGSLEVYGALDSNIIDYKGASTNTLKLVYRGSTLTAMIGAAFGSPGVYYLGTVVHNISFLPMLDFGWRF